MSPRTPRRHRHQRAAAGARTRELCFAHHSFQEYLAAAQIRQSHPIPAAWLEDSRWREAILLAVAGADASPVVQICLGQRSARALTLAFQCADQASTLEPHLREQLDALLAEALAPDLPPERCHLLAALAASRYLRETVTVADGVRICPQPVTNDIYAVFLHQMEARGDPRPPDAPAPCDSEPGAVAVGMRGSDAATFVNWLNELSGGDPVYRLPTRAEIDEVTARQPRSTPERSVWLLPTGRGDHPELWLPPSLKHPVEQQLWVLASNKSLMRTPDGQAGADAWLGFLASSFSLVPLLFDCYSLIRRIVTDQLRHDGGVAPASGLDAWSLNKLVTDTRRLARDLIADIRVGAGRIRASTDELDSLETRYGPRGIELDDDPPPAPILNRDRSPDPRTVAVVTKAVSTLCELFRCLWLSQDEVSRPLTKVAKGVTMMQARRSGLVSATETIMVAVA